MSRMLEIPSEKLTAIQRQILAERAAGPIATVGGPAVPLIRSPELMRHLQKVGEHLRTHSAIGLRLHAIAILMTARHWTQQYVWDYWHPVASKAGVTPIITRAIAEGRRPESMASDEEVLYDFLSELFANQCVSDRTYERAIAQFGEQGVVDAVAAVGHFSSLSMIMNVVRTDLPEGHSPALPVLP